ncbi:phytanoyl-CoA dioxygenase family protein [Pseudomonas piscis]|uniref:phytanoyl-CoA dioxygenase family protein n=1 Tax=Pseudomonas piscis TaxID=2614538 RepID=UPI0003B4F3E9|nr:phytanoyl-CoA dioxygenase family protein [Pseudomonas piscis]ERO60738.1 hypothetical protein P308_12850 [Pseudomonas piscis]
MNLPQPPAPCLVNPLPLDPQQRRLFHEQGYLKLPGLLTSAAIEPLRQLVEQQLRPAQARAGEGFNCLTHRLEQDGILRQLQGQPALAQVLTYLTDSRLILCEAQGFELGQGRSGFAWHYDSLNFRYIRPQDPAFSLWLPLQPVRPEAQGGGMAWVPLSLCSALGNFQFSRMLAQQLALGESITELSELLCQTYASPGPLTERFERQRIEEAFEPGDALLFSKYLWHRSSPLLAGELSRRQAVTLRLVAAQARLDPLLQDGETRTTGGLGMGQERGALKPLSYGSRFVDIQAGDLLSSSAHCGPLL